MAELGSCVVHNCSQQEAAKHETLVLVTPVRQSKLCECAQMWLLCDKEPQKTLAANVTKLFLTDHDDSNNSSSGGGDNKNNTLSYGVHPTCYSKFTNVSKIPKPTTTTEILESDDDYSEPVKKRLRSTSKLKCSGKPVLPKTCVICKSTKKYFKLKGVTRLDTLSKAETIAAGKLREAAVLNDDTALLMIVNSDCVAQEVHYHRTCYSSYTKKVYQQATRKLSQDNEWDDNSPEHIVYQRFCKEVIEGKILMNKACYHLTDLLASLNKMLMRDAACTSDFGKYTSKLKYRLKRDYPALVFEKSKKANVSDFVFVDHLALDDIVPERPVAIATTSEDDTEDSASFVLPTQSNELYHTGRLLKNSLDEQPELTLPWPPTAKHFTNENAMAVIPANLYNLIALVVGASEEVPDENSFLELDISLQQKVLSICQDIVYLHSKGKKQVPKSISLGLSLKHLTGSSRIVNLLNRYGHCTSTKSVARHATALAQRQLATSKDIPEGFAKHMPTILIWDNNDFLEVTLTGANTTHHTNGIMVQQCYSSHSNLDVEGISKRAHKFKMAETTINPFYLRSKCGPQTLSTSAATLESCRNRTSSTVLKDFAFIAMKALRDTTSLPGWTPFNRKVCELSPLAQSAIHYLPVIEYSPTDLATVNHVLEESVRIADRLELETIVAVFDQAIYSKAQQIRWKNEQLGKRLVLRLGEFHTIMSFLAIVGKRFRMSGIEDILIESEAIASGSLNGMMSGHMYNRSIRCHKLLFEALSRMQFQHYLDSLGGEKNVEYETLLKDMVRTFDECSVVNLSPDLVALQKEFSDFIEEQSSRNPTYAFWNTYLCMIQQVLAFIRATRESNWEMHLAALRQMLPWYFSYDRHNYARYAPAYWLEMSILPQSHPHMNQHFIRGAWTVQRTKDNQFGSIPADQAIEQTINRQSKTAGGLTGITLNRGAVQRWILSEPDRAAVTHQCEHAVGLSQESREHKELDDSRKKLDEEAVQKIINTISSMINPWETDQDQLISLSSGRVVSDDIKKDLLKAEEIGEYALNNFIEERLVNKTTDIFTPLKSFKLKTFASTSTTTLSRKDQATAVMKSDRSIFSRLLIASSTRDIDMKNILKYSLSPVSLPLSSADGSLCKTNKSVLLSIIENEAASVSEPDNLSDTALVVDAMAEIQAMSAAQKPATFGQLADHLLSTLVKLAAKHLSSRIDFVGDRYLTTSIKNLERTRRSQATSQRIVIFGPQQRLPTQWKKFLSNGRNKEDLLSFLCKQWKESTISTALTVYVTDGRTCCKLTFLPDVQPGVELVTALQSDHEEADTRLVLHGLHASVQHKTVIIKSPDTDVALLCLSTASQFTELLFLTGVKNRQRLINISEVASCLGGEVCTALIGFHSFTGCDTTSAFHGKGKKTCWLLMMKDAAHIQLLSKLGRDYSLDMNLVPQFEKLVCSLYKTPGNSVNEARYKLFCTSSSTEQSLPPTQDALIHHLRRVNYQSAIWKRCDVANNSAPAPDGYGWEIDDETISIVWMSEPCVPKDILQCISCKCQKSMCKGSRCSCTAANLPCTDLCHCVNCDNQSKDDDTSEPVFPEDEDSADEL